jgi:chromosome segregation ATPase
MTAHSMNNFISIIQLFSPILLAGLTGGSLVAYFNYRSKRPESLARANAIDATTSEGITKQWERYAEKIETRMNEMSAEIEALRKDVHEKERATAEKVVEIIELKRQVKDLYSKNRELERRLKVYETVGEKVENAKIEIHHTVEEQLNDIKNEKSD